MNQRELEGRVIIVAPLGRDASAMARVLSGAGFPVLIHDGSGEASLALREGAACLLFAEEALGDEDTSRLLEAFGAQPPWSEVPLIVLTRGGESRYVKVLDLVAAASGVAATLLERPVAAGTLVLAVTTAVRARRRQYEMRDLLASLSKATAEANTARAAAEDASRAKDDFIAALSHELRTPLFPILLTSADLAADESLPGPVRGQLEMIRRNCELEARLIDDLLDLTRITRGLLHVDAVPCDLHELLLQTGEVVKAEMTEGGVPVRMELGADCHGVIGDPVRLQQVFWNLLRNAVKFSEGRGEVLVETENPAPGRIMVRVTDRGIGMAPGALSGIFQPFDQGDLAGRHRFGGLGLGLAISKAIVDALGGTLRAASGGLGKGAAFTLEMELARSERGEHAPLPSPVAAKPGGPLRILLVEDHDVSRETLARLLERDGHSVHKARGVREALAAAVDHPVDLVISDLGLPDGDGLSLMKSLRARHTFPGIAMSGYGMDSDLRKSREAGFSDHLVKPLQIAVLKDAIYRALEEKETQPVGRATREDPPLRRVAHGSASLGA